MEIPDATFHGIPFPTRCNVMRRFVLLLRGKIIRDVDSKAQEWQVRILFRS